MLKGIKSLLGSNRVIDSLKDDGLYTNYLQFRHVNAQHSEFEAIDKALVHHNSSKEFNEAMNERSEKLAKKISNTKNENKRTTLETQKKAISDFIGIGEEEFAKEKAFAASAEGKAKLKKEYEEAIAGPAKGLKDGLKGYYNTGDFEKNATRIGATAVAYGATAVGSRYATGGTATTNNKGERDIAGIPFF